MNANQKVLRLVVVQIWSPKQYLHFYFCFFVQVLDMQIVVSRSAKLLYEPPSLKTKAVFFLNIWKLSSLSIDFKQNIGEQ